MKTVFEGEKWKIDLWFINGKVDLEHRQKNLDISKVKITLKQKEKILEFKKYRQDNKIKVSGQKIYEMVINDGISDLEDFKKKL